MVAVQSLAYYCTLDPPCTRVSWYKAPLGAKNARTASGKGWFFPGLDHEPPRRFYFSGVAQLVEQHICNMTVGSSSLSSGVKNFIYRAVEELVSLAGPITQSMSVQVGSALVNDCAKDG